MIFQDPDASLNPRMRVGESVGEPLLVRGVLRGSAQRARVGSLLQEVGLDAPRMARYPHEFSGGQRQRLSIARALALEPKLVVCDEPALDVSVRSQILNLLVDPQRRLGVFISHDLSVIRHVSDRIAGMYQGRIVESAPRDVLFARPLHPYSDVLMNAIPIPTRGASAADRRPSSRESCCAQPRRPPAARSTPAARSPPMCVAASGLRWRRRRPGQLVACHLRP